jgi:hypothetical protein
MNRKVESLLPYNSAAAMRCGQESVDLNAG